MKYYLLFHHSSNDDNQKDLRIAPTRFCASRALTCYPQSFRHIVLSNYEPENVDDPAPFPSVLTNGRIFFSFMITGCAIIKHSNCFLANLVRLPDISQVMMTCFAPETWPVAAPVPWSHH